MAFYFVLHYFCIIKQEGIADRDANFFRNECKPEPNENHLLQSSFVKKQMLLFGGFCCLIHTYSSLILGQNGAYASLVKAAAFGSHHFIFLQCLRYFTSSEGILWFKKSPSISQHEKF